MSEPTFGDWIRVQRTQKSRKWSQSRLARELAAVDPSYKGSPSYISKLESGEIGLPEEATRERFHKVFGTSDQDLVALGIVPQYDEWGRPIPAKHAGIAEAAPTYTGTPGNPFPVDDTRHELVELLAQLPLKGPYSGETSALIRQFKEQISARLTRFAGVDKRPALVDRESHR